MIKKNCGMRTIVYDREMRIDANKIKIIDKENRKVAEERKWVVKAANEQPRWLPLTLRGRISSGRSSELWSSGNSHDAAKSLTGRWFYT